MEEAPSPREEPSSPREELPEPREEMPGPREAMKRPRPSTPPPPWCTTRELPRGLPRHGICHRHHMHACIKLYWFG